MKSRVILEVIVEQNIHLFDIFAECLTGGADFVSVGIFLFNGISPLYLLFFTFPPSPSSSPSPFVFTLTAIQSVVPAVRGLAPIEATVLRG